MKISAGIVNEADIKLLARAGADEFFCGIHPPEWRRRFGPEISPNARTVLFCNCQNYAQLRKVIAAAHEIRAKIFVNFNAHYYTGYELPLLRSMIEKSIEYGSDGIIVADIGLLQSIKEWKIDTNIILSGEYGARNTYDIKIVADNFKIQRVILPRHMSLDNMERLVKAFPQYEFEAFGMLGRCFFDGANCMPTHTQDRSFELGRFFCSDFIDSTKIFQVHDDKFYTYFKYADNALLEYITRGKISGLVTYYGQKHEHAPTACGLCAMPRLKNMGISSVKVPCRGTVNPAVLAAVRLLRHMVNGRCSIDKIKKMYRDSFKGCAKEMCEAGYTCYYNN